jgi:hypothetical protein
VGVGAGSGVGEDCGVEFDGCEVWLGAGLGCDEEYGVVGQVLECGGFYGVFVDTLVCLCL